MKHAAIQFDYILPTPVGSLGLVVSDQGIRCLGYVTSRCKSRLPRIGLAVDVHRQLKEYFAGGRTDFCLPLDVAGTPFQQSVWRELEKIEFGCSLTYAELAKRLHTGARAVGNACRQNPVSIVVPCHRVVSKSGVGGYSGHLTGDPVARKQWLLQHEGAL